MHYFKNRYNFIFKTTIVGLFICVFHSFNYAQNIAESTGADCSQSRLIILPFVKDTGQLKNTDIHTISQDITYDPRDQFSFWYKLKIEKDTIINCQITPINKNDKYIIYIYKYRGSDFCEKVVNRKIKPARVENENNKKSIIEASATSDFEFDVWNGDVFYFCILNISQNNCGQNLRIITGADTLKITANHTPCIGNDKKIVKSKKDLIAEANPNAIYDTVTIDIKEATKANKNLNGKIVITDDITGKQIKIDSSKHSLATMVIERGKKYRVDCNVTGYKNFYHNLVISEYLVNNSFVVYLKALKTGDNFVMDNIYFYPNTYALKDESQDALGSLLSYLVNNPETKIELQGHTNGNNRCKKNKGNKNKGPGWEFSGSAKKLSLLRAEAIKKYLVDNGVNKNNIKTVGFGGEKMIVANPNTAEALKKNVRVEIVILETNAM